MMGRSIRCGPFSALPLRVGVIWHKGMSEPLRHRCVVRRGRRVYHQNKAAGPTLDAYMDIAQMVLRSVKRPMTARAIMAAAYGAGIVPPHLYGKTQHKTLGARLSEDIVQRTDRSAFFRTAPGKYFLREFLTDTSIPDEYRRPVPTRRRFRDLVLGPALALDERTLANRVSSNKPIEPEIILELLHTDNFRYEDPRRHSSTSVFCRSFVCVRRESKVLSYRLGRYREDRDAFMHRRSIGFSTLVHDFEATLFNQLDLGIVESGVRITKVDLDIPDAPSEGGENQRSATLSHFIWVLSPGLNDLLAVVCFECPPWFEPTKRRLALNDVQWIDSLSSINNVDDFDPWSQMVLASAT